MSLQWQPGEGHRAQGGRVRQERVSGQRQIQPLVPGVQVHVAAGAGRPLCIGATLGSSTCSVCDHVTEATSAEHHLQFYFAHRI